MLARLEEPRSKRQTVAEQHAVRWAPVSLNRVYQTMDYLDDFRIDKIIRGWRQRVHLMLGGPITAVFYDTTTLAFESDREDLGERRRKGFSKDHKPHDGQVLFALLITPEGLPLGFRVYPGNKYEGHTLLAALAAFQDEGFPRDMTVIADAGLCTLENQRLLRQAGYSYVLGHRLRTLGQRWHEQLFDLERYTETKVPNGTAVKLLVLYEGDQRIIVTYSAKRARKEATEREKKLATLRPQVGEQAPIKEFMKSHDSKYLKVRNNTVVELNEEAIAKEARWDGLKAVATNRDNPLPDAQLIAQYRQLWVIEDCFRAQKDDLKVRPMYHWQDRRIKAHLMICFMAYCCVQELRFRLQQRRRQLSVKKLVRKLNQTNFPVVTNIDSNRNFILAGAMNTEVKAIMKLFGINWPKFSFELPQKK